MATACALRPKVKNKKGDIVDSRFFEDLLSIFPKDRSTAKKHYYIGTHDAFLEEFQEKIELDENGEITIDSYKNITNLDLDEIKLLETLNKKYKTGELDSNEAIGIAQRFNSLDSFKKDYIATLTEANNGKIKVEIKKRTLEEETKLKEFHKRRNLVNRIIESLRKAGVDVKFLEEGSQSINGRYSTINAEKTYDGLYTLISVLSGDKVLDNLAHEAGHFVYGAMRNNPLMQRLYNSLTPEVIQEIFDSKDYIGYNLDNEELKTELAGQLIGRALLNKDKSKLKNLTERIVLNVKRLFATITKDDVRKLALEAEIIADKAANNFLSSNFTGNIETALSVKENLYSTQYTKQAEFYHSEILKRLKVYQKQMSTLSYEHRKKYKQQINSLVGETTSKIAEANALNAKTFEKLYAANGVVDALNFLISEYEPLREKLKNINFSTGEIKYEDLNVIIEARQYLELSTEILKIVQEALIDPEIFDSLGEGYKTSINNAYSALQQLIHSQNFTNTGDSERNYKSSPTLRAMIENLEIDAYCLFLEKNYGSKYIRRAQRVVIKRGDKWYKPKIVRVTGPNGEVEWDENIRDYLKATSDTLHEEGTILGWFTESFANIKDPTGQMFDDLLRHANRYANKNVLDSRKLLLELFDDLEQMQVKNPLVKALYNGVDSSVFYETDDDGKFTGNIIQFYNWGKWEKDLSEAYKQWKEEFKQLYASTPELINTNEKYNLRWDQFKTKKLNDWHNLHSHYNANENTYYPATGQVEVVGNVTISKLDYTNSKYTALSGEEKDWINNWIDLKKHLDSQLGKGRHTKYYRLPQFRGDVIEKTRTALQHSEGQNAWEKGINKAKNASTSLLDSLVEQFVLTSEDADYGSDEFYKADEDYLNPEGNGIYGEKLQRLPLYGINKLDDQELLSRDLMYSTLMYAAMAYKYAALSEACYAAQLGEQVYSKLNTRLSKGFSNKYGADTTKFKDFVGYSFLGRFRRYSDKALYKRYNITKFGKLSINKIATFFSRLGSTVTVAGNLTSGIKDLYGKLNGILREAHVSDYVTGKSVMKALWWYMKNVPEHVINLGNPYANDPISQFKSYFNVSDTLDQEFKEFETQKWKVRKILDSVLYAPLTASGDIETVMYIAVAYDTKVRDTKTGSIFNLMDFFIQNHKNKTLHERFDYFTDENDLLKDLSTDKLDRYNAMMETINKLEDFYNTHKGKITLQDQAALLASFSPEAINYITEYNNRGIQDNKEVLRLAKLEREEIIYNTKDEAVGVEGLGRFINNRIAGVYNLQDRTAFQDTWFGTIVYAQKGWFTGSVAEAELSSPRFNTKTKAENEGAKYTLVTFLLDLLYGEENNRKDLLLGFMCSGAPGNLGKNSKELLLAAGYSPNQIANLTRNIDHILTILALKGVSALFLVLSRVLANAGKEVPDDEDDALLAWAKAFGVLHYYAKASELELASMYLPWLLVKQITTSSDASKFVGIVGMVKICQLLVQAPAALRNNIVNKYNTDIVYSIDENEVHKSVITREYAEKLGISLIGVQKDKEGNIKVVKEYKRYEKDTTLEDGTEVKKGDFVLDSNGRRILERIRPLYKQQYAKSDRYSTFYTDDPRYKYVGGENKVKRTFNKITPYFKHRDMFNDPIEAAENLEKWWFKN